MAVFAIDCEMVGSGKKSVLARVSIVNQYRTVILDEYVKPTVKITDYRTFVSGIKKQHLDNGRDLIYVKSLVAPLLKKSILVGHSLDNDLKALGLCHPEDNRRDLAEYEPLRHNGRPQSLEKLARLYLNKEIQKGEHDSIEDAQTAMELYQLFADKWN